MTTDWIVRVAAGAAAPGPPDPHGQSLGSLRLDTSSPLRPGVASNGRAHLVFAGVLDNVADIEAACAASDAPRHEAALLLAAWDVFGERLIDRLRGAFALLVWNAANAEMLAFRDHLGLYPLFWAEAGPDAVLISPSIARLLAHPGVPRAINRAALADHLCHRWPDKEESCFQAVRRVPPGHVLRVTGRARGVERHWTPGIRNGRIDWIGQQDLERFDQLFEQAVRRAVGGHLPAISLSGGLDSISVAVVAAAQAATNGRLFPVALSLGFPGDSDEEPVQRAVAADLGLDQIFVPILQTAGQRGIVGASLDLGAHRDLPLLSPWCSAYAHLAGRARTRGVEVVLTGTGGDEWLTVTPYYAADLLRAADIGGLLRLATATHRSFDVSWLAVARTLFRFGVRPLVSLSMDTVAPRYWHGSRLRRLLRTTPPWLAPDTTLRREMDERAERGLMHLRPPGGFYTEELRASLDHPLVAWEIEESFETGQEAGIMYRHPYLDADLVDFLFRTPPRLLNRGGRSKGLVRAAVSRRFPSLGFDRQKKVTGTSFYRALLLREGPVEWARLGGTTKLAETGIVDLNGMVLTAEKIFQGSLPEVHRIWDVLGLEAWARTHG